MLHSRSELIALPTDDGSHCRTLGHTLCRQVQARIAKLWESHKAFAGLHGPASDHTRLTNKRLEFSTPQLRVVADLCQHLDGITLFDELWPSAQLLLRLLLLLLLLPKLLLLLPKLLLLLPKLPSHGLLAG